VEKCRDKEVPLRERRPNGANTDELLELMKDTRAARRAWITKDSPSISEIIRRYPRFQDLNSTVCSILLFDVVTLIESDGPLFVG
jgi:hypothetical protein